MPHHELSKKEYSPNVFSRLFANILIHTGDFVYGIDPSYAKFRAIEVVARAPYHSWTSALYTLMTIFYHHEDKAIELSKLKSYAREAQDNETMHVVVISHLSARMHKPNFILYNLIPIIFAFFYFWVSYVLYLTHRKSSLEMNYIFESHAHEQYNLFLEKYENSLKNKTVDSKFLLLYGRDPASQYEFFAEVALDEARHRDETLRQIRDLR